MATGVLEGDDRLSCSPCGDEGWAIVDLPVDGHPGVHYDDQGWAWVHRVADGLRPS